MTEKIQRVVGFCGPRRAGKNTAGERLLRLKWYRHEMSDTMRHIMDMCLGFQMSDADYEYTKDQQLTLNGRSFRDFYIGIGQGLRKYVDPDIHRNIFTSTIDKVSRDVFTPSIRANNEAEAVKQRGGIIIEIDRKGQHYDYNDVTEKGIDRYLIDCSIRNGGTKEQLWNNVDEAIRTHYE